VSSLHPGARDTTDGANDRTYISGSLGTKMPWALSHNGRNPPPGDLQLPDLPVQIVDHLLRILNRRRLIAARKQLGRTLHQLLLPAADHRRMNPKLRRQLRQGLLPRKRRHRHSRLECCAVLLPLYTHVSRPFGPVSL
jgi:hypothetical protein